MNKRLLVPQDLVLGKTLLWDVYDAHEVLLLRRGHVISSQQLLDKMSDRGLFVDATEYSRHAHAGHDSKMLMGNAIQEQKEVRSSLRLINQAYLQLERLLTDIPQQNGGALVSSTFREIANAIKEAIEINPDVALAYILFIQKPEGYAVRHSLACAILSVLIGQTLGKSEDEITKIACAALSMNVSLCSLQESLQSREAGPTAEEMNAIRQHPLESVEMLRRAGVTDEAWLDYIRSHHENIDGTGYPDGKSGDGIPENARLISLADRYTALLAPRTYRPAILPSEALRNMLLERGKSVDATMAAHFIRILGIYPPGAFVKLESGEVAVVTKRSKNSSTPVVHALLAPRGYPLPYPHKRETDNPRYAIREPLRPDWENIPFTMQHIWGKEASE